MKPASPTTPPTEYRIFVLPGHGRVRAPAHMTEDELRAALSDTTDTANGKNT
jgi:hypothetical protein